MKSLSHCHWRWRDSHRVFEMALLPYRIKRQSKNQEIFYLAMANRSGEYLNLCSPGVFSVCGKVFVNIKIRKWSDKFECRNKRESPRATLD